MVNDMANINIIIDMVTDCLLSNIVKKAKSGLIFEFFEIAIKPLNPIKKTIGIIIIKEIIKLFF